MLSLRYLCSTSLNQYCQCINITKLSNLPWPFEKFRNCATFQFPDHLLKVLQLRNFLNLRPSPKSFATSQLFNSQTIIFRAHERGYSDTRYCQNFSPDTRHWGQIKPDTRHSKFTPPLDTQLQRDIYPDTRHSTWTGYANYYRPRSEGDNVLGSVRPSVRLSVRPSVRLSVRPSVRPSVTALTAEPFDLCPWYWVCRLTLTLARLGL